MKKLLLLLPVFALLSAMPSNKKPPVEELDKLINDWHIAAANAQFDTYFGLTTKNFIFLGTDPTERWTRKEFEGFCKPYFDTGKAWDFKPGERHWIFSENGKTAWFDEKLSTWMEECRGSGVVVKEKGKWKLAYYNLTVLIENDKIKKFIELRRE